MPTQIVKRRSRGFICVNAHPEGCRRNVERQIAVAGKAPPGPAAPRNVLVIGASTGYGLASRIAAAWGYDARTLGVFFERPPDGDKTATAGYYNTVALHERAKRDGLFAASINGDAFSDDCKRETIAIIRRELAPLDLVIYSLASPKRIHPRTGVAYNSALKPIGQSFSSRTIELDSEKVVDVTLGPATEKEIADTIAVMGGEDWRMWVEAFAAEGLLAPGARTLAYSYIGPELTWPIYRDGTIGRAKQDLERTARALDAHAERQARRARLGIGKQGGGDAGFGGDSRRAAVSEPAVEGDARKGTRGKSHRAGVPAVFRFSGGRFGARHRRRRAHSPGRSRDARGRASRSGGALAASDHGKSAHAYRLRAISARIPQFIRLRG